jgi:hypothetical protein
MWRLLLGRGRICLPWLRSSPSPWVERGGDRRLRPGLSPSPGVGRSGVRRLPGLSSSPSPGVGRIGVRRLPVLSPSPSPGSGGAEFTVFRGCARVRALGRAERSSPSSGAAPESEPWGGRSGVRRLPGPSPSPSPGVGRSGVRRLPMVPEAGPDCLSASLCRVAQQSERRRRRCPSIRPVSGAAK